MANQFDPTYLLDARDPDPAQHIARDRDLLDVRLKSDADPAEAYWEAWFAFCREKQDARRLALRAELDRLRESGAEAEALK